MLGLAIGWAPGEGFVPRSLRSRVYEALDSVLAGASCAVPAGVEAVVQGALFELRMSGSDAAALAELEVISTALSALSAAGRGDDATERQACMTRIARLSDDWMLATRIH